MESIIIFESLVIPAIITFMIIALFVLDRNNLFFKKSGIFSKKNNNGENSMRHSSKNQLPNKKYDHLDYSGGTWGI